MAETKNQVLKFQQRGMLLDPTKLSADWQQKLNALSDADVEALLRVNEKLGIGKGVLEPRGQDFVILCGF
jgi:hypothetical protein